MARGFALIPEVDLTVIVNVGDDAVTHGLAIAPDLDTVMYTLAGIEGPLGWGRSNDSFIANEELARLGVDNTFKIGDLDLAVKLARTGWLREGQALSDVTKRLCSALGVGTALLPATDQSLQTEIGLDDGTWISFQEYFVRRGHADTVARLRFLGEKDARPAPGVATAIEKADLLVIAPSNPPLSVWPILAVPGIREEVTRHPHTVAVSPLIGGKALKGPADRVLMSLGLPPGNVGVAAAYAGLIQMLVIDRSDAGDHLEGVGVMVEETHIGPPEAARRLARAILDR